MNTLPLQNHMISVTNKSKQRVEGMEAMIFLTLTSITCILSLLTSALGGYLLWLIQPFPSIEPIVFTDSGETIFRGDLHANTLQLSNGGRIQLEEGATIEGPVELQSGESKLQLDVSGIQINAKHGLKVISPKTGRQLFPPQFDRLRLPDLQQLQAPSGLRDVLHIRSPADQPLKIRADGIQLLGNGGLHLDGKSVKLEAKSIHLNSINGSTIIDASSVILHVPRLWSEIPNSPVDEENTELNKDQEVKEETKLDTEMFISYKLCVCSDSGLLFRVQVRDLHTSCSDVRFPVSQNPCPRF